MRHCHVSFPLVSPCLRCDRTVQIIQKRGKCLYIRSDFLIRHQLFCIISMISIIQALQNKVRHINASFKFILALFIYEITHLICHFLAVKHTISQCISSCMGGRMLCCCIILCKRIVEASVFLIICIFQKTFFELL